MTAIPSSWLVAADVSFLTGFTPSGFCVMEENSAALHRSFIWGEYVMGSAYYAVQFLELGTKHIAKQPWLTKSLKRKRSNVVTKLSTLLRKKIEKEAAK